jgi:hypothetical protein
MFGQPDNNQQTATANNPSMLDNVSSNDLQGQQPTAPTNTPDPATAQSGVQHPLTTDNPFAQLPADPTTTTSDPSTVQPDEPAIAATPAPSVSPSEPTAAPVFQVDDSADSEAEAPQPEFGTDNIPTGQPVDHNRLASMKQEAMSHLEPLVDHIDGTPEETFKTTMMMIQANDNHLLLDKALDAAKKINDDKARAEALLDIINEINYFSQNG